MFDYSLEPNTTPCVKLPHKMKTRKRYQRADPAFYYVYELRCNGQVVYVGITQNPGGRFAQYTKRGKYKHHNSKLVQFLERGIDMYLVAYLESKEARKLELDLIKNYGNVVNVAGNIR